MNSKKEIILAIITNILLVAIVISLGIAANSVLVGLLCFTGVAGLIVAVKQAAAPKRVVFFIATLVGLGCLISAIWLSQLAGRWLWTPLWLYIALLLWASGKEALKNNRKWIGNFMSAAAVTGGFFSILGPLLLYRRKALLVFPDLSGPSYYWIWGILAVVGLSSMTFGWKKGSKYKPLGFVLFSTAGILLLGAATWLSHSAGQWWCSLLWFLVAILLGHAAWRVRRVNSKTGKVALSVALICAIFAAASPLIISSAILQPTVLESSQPRAIVPEVSSNPSIWSTGTWYAIGKEGAKAIGNFFSTVLRSFWGVAYLLTIFFLGHIWIRKWGGVMLLGSALICMGLAGVLDPVMFGRLKQLFVSGPATLMQNMLEFSTRHLGSLGWGASIGGMVVSWIVFPAIRDSIQFNRLKIKKLRVGNNFGKTSLKQRLKAGGNFPPVAFFALLLTNMAIPIILWAALRRFAGGGGGTSFPILGIPDLSVAHFKPVWHFSYFVVGYILWMSITFRRMVEQRYEVIIKQPHESILYIIVSFLFALFVPAGVLLFLTGQNITVLLATSLVCSTAEDRRVAKKVVTPPPSREPDPVEIANKLLEILRKEIPVKAPPSPPRKESPLKTPPSSSPSFSKGTPGTPEKADPYIPDEKLLERVGAVLGSALEEIDRQEESPEPSPAPPIEPSVQPAKTIQPSPVHTQRLKEQKDAGECLYRHSRPLIDMTVTEQGIIYLLDGSGGLIRVEGGKVRDGGDRGDVSLENPLGFALDSLGRAVVSDRAGQLIFVTFQKSSPPMTSKHVRSTPINCFAMNPFGSIIALAPFGNRGQGVGAYVISSGQEQALIDDLISVSALAFSLDGRYMGIGFADGNVVTFDMVKRNVELRINVGFLANNRVVALSPGPKRRWIAAYENNYIVCFDSSGQIEHKKKNSTAISCLAVARNSGTVAIGSKGGSVHVLSPDLGRTDFHKRVHMSEVVRVVFPGKEETFISASRDGSVCEVRV